MSLPQKEKINRYPTSYKRRQAVITTIIQIKRKCSVIIGAVFVSYCGLKFSVFKQQKFILSQEARNLK